MNIFLAIEHLDIVAIHMVMLEHVQPDHLLLDSSRRRSGGGADDFVKPGHKQVKNLKLS